MQLTHEECQNAALVLKQTQQALKHKDALKLKDLSNRTIHSSCTFQNSGSITSAVLIYALSKLIERSDFQKIENWDSSIKKFNAMLDLAILALEDNNQRAYEKHIKKARSILELISPNLKPYISEVLKKAAINKGSKIYEHGVSLGHTARLLGISKWELSSYISQKSIHEIPQNKTIPIQTRARVALEFFQE